MSSSITFTSLLLCAALTAAQVFKISENSLQRRGDFYGGIASWAVVNPDNALEHLCLSGYNLDSETSTYCCPSGTAFDYFHTTLVGVLCCPTLEDCGPQVINGIVCADPTGTLFTIGGTLPGCCPSGYVVSDFGLCSNNSTLSPGYSSVAQNDPSPASPSGTITGLATVTAIATNTDSATIAATTTNTASSTATTAAGAASAHSSPTASASSGSSKSSAAKLGGNDVLSIAWPAALALSLLWMFVLAL